MAGPRVIRDRVQVEPQSIGEFAQTVVTTGRRAVSLVVGYCATITNEYGDTHGSSLATVARGVGAMAAHLAEIIGENDG